MALCKICNPGRSSMHKHSDETIKEIRTRVDKGEMQKTIAEDLTIDTSTISKIVNYKIYEWVK